MIRRLSVVVALLVVTGCSGGTTESTLKASSPETFAGVWRSVTPSLEFMGLSVYSTSSQAGVLAARLTFSGVYWDGSGRIDGDSMVTGMTFNGTEVPSGVIVAHALDAHTLRVQVRPTVAPVIDLTFVRDQ